MKEFKMLDDVYTYDEMVKANSEDVGFCQWLNDAEIGDVWYDFNSEIVECINQQRESSILMSLKQEMIDKGYCVNPNNIYKVEGFLMYKSGYGGYDAPLNHEIHVKDGCIEILKVTLEGLTFEVVEKFYSVSQCLHWLETNGEFSQGGINFDYID